MNKDIWEREPSSLPIFKEGMPIRLRPKTKGQLVEIYNRGGYPMSPIIQTEVREGADDVTLRIAYEIINVEAITTDVQGLSGIRVSLRDQKGGEGNVMLWQRKVTGTGSKLGVFIIALGHNTDKWLHKWLIFKVWEDRKRELEVMPAPVAKVKPAPKKKAS